MPLEQIRGTGTDDQSVFGLSPRRSSGRLSSARHYEQRPSGSAPPSLCSPAARCFPLPKIHRSGGSDFKIKQLQELTEAHGFPLQCHQRVAQPLGRVVTGEKQQALGLPEGTRRGIPQRVPGTGGMLPDCYVCCLLGRALLPEPEELQHLVTF